MTIQIVHITQKEKLSKSWKKNVTRKDIAKEAGVSVSVVSRALNNSGYVDNEKKRRILEIANRVGYMPNPVANGIAAEEDIPAVIFLRRPYRNIL